MRWRGFSCAGRGGTGIGVGTERDGVGQTTGGAGVDGVIGVDACGDGDRPIRARRRSRRACATSGSIKKRSARLFYNKNKFTQQWKESRSFLPGFLEVLPFSL